MINTKLNGGFLEEDKPTTKPPETVAPVPAPPAPEPKGKE